MAVENAKTEVAEEAVAAADVAPPEDKALWAEFEEDDKKVASKAAVETVAADKPKDSEAPKGEVEAKTDAKSDREADAEAAETQVKADEDAATAAKTETTDTAKGAKAAEAAGGTVAKQKATTTVAALDEATLAALPEPAREHLKRLETENRSHRGRQSRLDRAEADLVTLRAENESLKKVAKPAVGTDGKALSAESVAEWSQFESDYPELATAIGKKFGTKIETLEARLAAAEGVTKGVQTQQSEAFIDQQIALVAEAHPDWSKVIGSKEFKTFVETGPRRVKDAFKRNFDAIVDAEEVEWLLDDFKANAGTPTQATTTVPSNGGTSATKSSPLTPKRERQLKAAGSPAPGVSSRVPNEGVPAQLEDDKAMWDALEKLDRAKGVGAGL